MAGAKRSKVQREQDLLILSERYLRGDTQASIAGDLGVTQQQIAYDLKTLYARWEEGARINVASKVARELAKIDRLEREYWAAWEESRKEHIRTTTERIAGKSTREPARERAQIVKEKMLGNPSYLAGVQWCIDRRCKLMGLDVPSRIDLRVLADQIAEAEGLTPEERTELHTEIAQFLKATTKP